MTERHTDARHIRTLVQSANGRARRMGLVGHFSTEEWIELCETFQWRCVRCGKEGPLEIDHIFPLAQGGSPTIHNIQPLCKSCNSSKNSLHTTDYRQSPFELPPIDRGAKAATTIRLSEAARERLERLQPDYSSQTAVIEDALEVLENAKIAFGRQVRAAMNRLIYAVQANEVLAANGAVLELATLLHSLPAASGIMAAVTQARRIDAAEGDAR